MHFPPFLQSKVVKKKKKVKKNPNQKELKGQHKHSLVIRAHNICLYP